MKKHCIHGPTHFQEMSWFQVSRVYSWETPNAMILRIGRRLFPCGKPHPLVATQDEPVPSSRKSIRGQLSIGAFLCQVSRQQHHRSAVPPSREGRPAHGGQQWFVLFFLSRGSRSHSAPERTWLISRRRNLRFSHPRQPPYTSRPPSGSRLCLTGHYRLRANRSQFKRIPPAAIAAAVQKFFFSCCPYQTTICPSRAPCKRCHAPRRIYPHST